MVISCSGCPLTLTAHNFCSQKTQIWLRYCDLDMTLCPSPVKYNSQTQHQNCKTGGRKSHKTHVSLLGLGRTVVHMVVDMGSHVRTIGMKCPICFKFGGPIELTFQGFVLGVLDV